MIYAVVGDTILIDIGKAFKALADYAAEAILSTEELKNLLEILSFNIPQSRNCYLPKSRADNYGKQLKRSHQFASIDSIYSRRLLFPKSGYLPWRLRRKKKDK